jgi:hypothetical protein
MLPSSRFALSLKRADQTGLGRQPRVGRGNQELPVADGGDSHASALAGALDTPPHRASRRAGSTTAVSVEEQRAIRLAEHVDARAGVELVFAVEGGQHPKGGDAVVGVPAKLGVDEEPCESLSILWRQLEAFEGNN